MEPDELAEKIGLGVADMLELLYEEPMERVRYALGNLADAAISNTIPEEYYVAGFALYLFWTAHPRAETWREDFGDFSFERILAAICAVGKRFKGVFTFEEIERAAEAVPKNLALAIANREIPKQKREELEHDAV